MVRWCKDRCMDGMRWVSSGGVWMDGYVLKCLVVYVLELGYLPYYMRLDGVQ